MKKKQHTRSLLFFKQTLQDITGNELERACKIHVLSGLAKRLLRAKGIAVHRNLEQVTCGLHDLDDTQHGLLLLQGRIGVAQALQLGLCKAGDQATEVA